MGSKHIYEFGPFRLDPAERQLWRNEKPVAVTPKSFDLLIALVENSGHLLEKEALLQRVWPNQFVEESNLSFNISTLRKVLGAGENGQPYIETVPKKGFRFAAPVTKHNNEYRNPVDRVETVVTSSTNAPGLGGSTATFQDEGRRTFLPDSFSRHPLRLGIGAAVLALGILGLALLGPSKKRSATPVGPVKTLAVLPFKPLSTESRDESLEMGMAEAMITRFSNIKQLVVLPLSAARKYTDLQQDPVKVGQELHTDAILDGSIQKLGERVRVTVRLTDVRSATSLWTEQFDANFSDIFRIQDSIAARVADALPLKLRGEEKERLAKHYTDNPEAYQLYLQGEYLWYKWDPKSLQFYQRATERDANFSLAYVGIAESYLQLIGMHEISAPEGKLKAKTAIRKALELDETLPEALNVLAEIKYQLEYDWAGAEQDFKRALELNPNSVQIRLAFGWYLMSAGRFDEAKSWMEKAQELDPHNRRINYAMAKLYYFMRQHDKAVERLQYVLMLVPNDASALWVMGDIYDLKGMHAQAIENYLSSMAQHGLRPEEGERLRAVFKGSGWHGFLEAQREEKSKARQVAPFEMAQLYARLGDKDQAFAWLEKAVNERAPFVIQLKIEPFYDGLRADPRYTKLLHQMNMTP